MARKKYVVEEVDGCTYRIPVRELKHTLNRFTYMSERDLLRRIGKIRSIDKINATIAVASKLDLTMIKEYAQVRKLSLIRPTN